MLISRICSTRQKLIRNTSTLKSFIFYFLIQDLVCSLRLLKKPCSRGSVTEMKFCRCCQATQTSPWQFHSASAGLAPTTNSWFCCLSHTWQPPTRRKMGMPWQLNEKYAFLSQVQQQCRSSTFNLQLLASIWQHTQVIQVRLHCFEKDGEDLTQARPKHVPSWSNAGAIWVLVHIVSNFLALPGQNLHSRRGHLHCLVGWAMGSLQYLDQAAHYPLVHRPRTCQTMRHH